MKKITAACAALLALAGFTGCEGLDEAMNEEEKNNTPSKVKEGARFTHDDFAVKSGWTVKKDALDLVSIEGMKVTNKSKQDRREALLVFRLYKGKDVLAEVTCSSNQMQTGETSPLDCLSGDDFPKNGYDAIKVSDAF